MVKRAIDITGSAAALVLLLPTLLVIATAILVCDGRPLFYRGIRTGRFGKPFRIFKFRTMVADAERLGGSATADTDVRITRIGRILRKHKLDELPQLINVLLGEMSLVGPRPEVPEYIALLSGAEQLILTVRPGITDWATLWDADEGALLAQTSDPERIYLDYIRPEKTKLQLKYVHAQSFWTDLLILCKSAYAIFFKPTPPAFVLLSSLTTGQGDTRPRSPAALPKAAARTGRTAADAKHEHGIVSGAGEPSTR
jgi:lipopolysaccharide/colanic/teichoic acid biosynthesis glycosyltransferase